MIKEKIKGYLKKREFLNVATCSPDGVPNAAPKFLLKFEGNHIYLADYTIGKTYMNLTVNKKISLCFMDLDTLDGYQMNGVSQILASGRVYEELLNEFQAKTTALTVDRIIEGLRGEKGHKHFELDVPDMIVIFKVTVNEIVRIGHKGELEKEQLL
jgi:predicted pyridoxine 5'-phosphate oxidase superfamily flavin-nucleotide-binding protein